MRKRPGIKKNNFSHSLIKLIILYTFEKRRVDYKQHLILSILQVRPQGYLQSSRSWSKTSHKTSKHSVSSPFESITFTNSIFCSWKKEKDFRYMDFRFEITFRQFWDIIPCGFHNQSTSIEQGWRCKFTVQFSPTYSHKVSCKICQIPTLQTCSNLMRVDGIF